jgi:hypothetical protein
MKNLLSILRGASIVAVSLLTASPAAAQGGPGGSAGPPLFHPDDAYLRWPLLPSEAAYGKIRGDRIKALLLEVTAISRKSRDEGNQYWGRITGTPYDAQTSEWALKHFKRIGLEQVRMQEMDLPPQWINPKWSANVEGGGKSVPLKTLFPWVGTPGTPAGGLELEPVWVGLGMPVDFLGKDVKGKAVFIYSIPTPGGLNFSANWTGAMTRAENAGAAAVVAVLGFPGNVTHSPGGEGAAVLKVPRFTLGLQDGTAVREMLEQGLNPKLKVQLTVNMVSGLKTANVWGVLPGATDENILIMAHSDAVFEGALDNASGMAGLMALAEYYAAIPRAQRRRTLTFLITPGHHAGDPGVRWIKENRDTMLAKTALILNCEHWSQTQTYLLGASLMPSNTIGARRWFLNGSDVLKKIIDKAVHTFGIALYSRPEDRAGGSLRVIYDDVVPSFHLIDHVFYHTDADVPERVPEAGLEAVGRAFAKIIDEVNKVDSGALRAVRKTSSAK